MTTMPPAIRRPPAPSTEDVGRLVELACSAPSVHNTQPWSWSMTRGRLRMYADRSRQLPVEDACGRNLMISCGAALHHLHVAAAAAGWRADLTLLPAGEESPVVAEARFEPTARSSAAEEDLEALLDRCTDRRRFTSWPVPDERLESLARTARAWGARATPVVDVSARFRLEVLANRARFLRAADRAAAAEQQRWTERDSADGVPLAVLPATRSTVNHPNRFGSGLLEDARPDVRGTDGLLVLGGAGDDPAGWLTTGMGLSALWLRATRDGLSVVPLSEPVELDQTRSELRDAVLGGTMAPHLLLRVGWQAIGRSELPRTPRRPLAEVFES